MPAMIEPVLYSRDAELTELLRRLRQRKSFLLHGPAGVGKTALLMAARPQTTGVLYAARCHDLESTFRSLVMALIEREDSAVIRRFGRNPGPAAFRDRSQLAVRGIVSQALGAGDYLVVLDHIGFPSQVYVAAIRKLVGWSTPLLVVARSEHMEDLGFLHRWFPDRSERMELKPFAPPQAAAFASQCAAALHLEAANLACVLELTARNTGGVPGAILALLQLAAQDKYHSSGQIKWAPLYIDFLLRRNSEVGHPPSNGFTLGLK